MDALLNAYLLRLGFDSRPEPTRASLEQLVTAHLFAVPFENLDVVEQRPIVLATPALVEKIVLRRRGGFCFEVNEAFAPVPMAWLKEIGADEKKLNPNGGAIALGHPLGGSGARIMTTMLYHMRDNNIRYGLQTMCEGGGQANATILELL